jgi:hypothetical protein
MDEIPNSIIVENANNSLLRRGRPSTITQGDYI